MLTEFHSFEYTRKKLFVTYLQVHKTFTFNSVVIRHRDTFKPSFLSNEWTTNYHWLVRLKNLCFVNILYRADRPQINHQ